MNQQNAFDRIAELEAKLKIATENAAQAVKERDETLNTLQEKDKRLLAKTSELEQWKAEAYKWRRIRTPTHGTCCTCQGCGQSHEDCKCSEEELEDALNQACKERDELRAAAGDILISLNSEKECFIPHHQVERLFKAVYGKDAKTPWEDSNP